MRLRLPVVVAVSVALSLAPRVALGDAFLLDPSGEERPLGPSTTWPTPTAEPLLRGPIWDDPTAVTMPPPRLVATVSELTSSVSWSLRLRITTRAPVRGRFVVGPSGAAVVEGGTHHAVAGRGELIVDLPAGEHVVTVGGTLPTHRLEHTTDDGFLDIPPIETRHLLLGTRSVVDAATVSVVVPAASVAPEGPYRVMATGTATIPDGWYGDDRSDHVTFPCTPRGTTESRVRCVYDGRRWGETHRTAVEAQAGTTGSEAHLTIEARSPLHRPVLIPGGPIVGVGAELGEGLRMRLGYELALKSRYLMLSGSVDTDYGKHAVAAVTLKTATSRGLAGLGLGLPVGVSPYAAGGVRGEADLFLGPVGFVASADVWLFSPSRVHVTGTLLGVVSF